jgi:beta-lactamase superfamily II metal-dependent hydrolase
MKLTDLAPFSDDELTVLLLGPGFGESVLVRWPPDDWLVIDSFRRADRGAEVHPMRDVLADFGAQPSAVALTHPHHDHTAGFASLIAARRRGAKVGWLAAPQRAWWSTPNVDRATRQGTTEHAIAAIMRIWEEEPECRWELHAGVSPLRLGAATIDVLSPPPATVDRVLATSRPDLNRISGAMLLTWDNCRVLLGADLTHPGWDEVEQAYGALHFADAAGIKVSHHGSEGAQHPIALGEPPARERPSLLSPYNRGKKVPNFADDQDVDLLLRLSSRLYLTAHHGPLPPGAGTGDVQRSSVSSPTRRVGRHRIAVDTPTPPLHDCWVAAQFGPDGALRRVNRGLGSMSIVA